MTRIGAFACGGMKCIGGASAVQPEKGESEKEKPHVHGYFVAVSKRGGLGFRYGFSASKRKSISAISSAFSFSSEKMGFVGDRLLRAVLARDHVLEHAALFPEVKLEAAQIAAGEMLAEIEEEQQLRVGMSRTVSGSLPLCMSSQMRVSTSA